VGQTELSIMDLPIHCVVTVPEAGDGVQVMSRLNEIADVFVSTSGSRRRRSDQGGTRAERPSARGEDGVRRLLTQAAIDQGVDSVVAAIAKHREYLRAHTDPAASGRPNSRIVEVLSAELKSARLARCHGGAPDVLGEIAGSLIPTAPRAAYRRSQFIALTT